MRKVANSYPTSIQPKTGEKLNDNSQVSNVSNYNKEIGWREGDINKIGSVGHIGDQLDTVDTAPAAPASRPLPVKRYVALNESGTQRIGEDHAMAKLSDLQVEAIRDEFEAYPLGHPLHIGYRLLAKKHGVGKRTIRDIVNYRKRNQWAGSWKKLPT